jgi:hypothetical protein
LLWLKNILVVEYEKEMLRRIFVKKEEEVDRGWKNVIR